MPDQPEPHSREQRIPPDGGWTRNDAPSPNRRRKVCILYATAGAWRSAVAAKQRSEGWVVWLDEGPWPKIDVELWTNVKLVITDVLELIDAIRLGETPARPDVKVYAVVEDVEKVVLDAHMHGADLVITQPKVSQ